ncbi:hypothetical protein PHYBLDRAFT_147085 [Phycomyces blakesleeanus NRRL 1555(-)]|uniref:Uncharacterized protein n=1 Tax=Phycomyces blakesleeanus (strain ATCC 8743b / DSM 1359 / FGSC 10004 / NBRC 33097 / NRRL 1555) TaxID=763407 RepID=A0A167M8D8_PHYB8|nr:hypothetical protein PHYBLDRAFT_147085 [Phycomyces blakesleeanus NRRL 1555(-)]OAD72107.1 hypothetical protein PHYBLDRAFT_147085 [Phycomyces blakesleeanus NRRL 1555(-)]|eukprot:XP_018290147.1 hypothetical protein PHYBLDRAFT_147085 [Phycomyces blakesleeanus NRRL 1555(-)]
MPHNVPFGGWLVILYDADISVDLIIKVGGNKLAAMATCQIGHMSNVKASSLKSVIIHKFKDPVPVDSG